MQNLLHALLSASLVDLVLACLAVSFSVILADSDSPLKRYFGILHDYMKDEQPAWKRWLAYVLGGCIKCFAGQLGLWTAVFYAEESFFLYKVPQILTCAGMALFFAVVVKHLLDKIIGQNTCNGKS